MEPKDREYPENATVVERLSWYVSHGETDKAEALALVCDQLEEGFLWDINFH